MYTYHFIFSYEFERTMHCATDKIKATSYSEALELLKAKHPHSELYDIFEITDVAPEAITSEIRRRNQLAYHVEQLAR